MNCVLLFTELHSPFKHQELAPTQCFKADTASSASGPTGLCLLKCSAGSDSVHLGVRLFVVRFIKTLLSALCKPIPGTSFIKNYLSFKEKASVRSTICSHTLVYCSSFCWGLLSTVRKRSWVFARRLLTEISLFPWAAKCTILLYHPYMRWIFMHTVTCLFNSSVDGWKKNEDGT